MSLLQRFKNTVKHSKRRYSASTPSVPPSVAYDLLSNKRRRHIIVYLVEMEGPITDAGEIADYLASIGDDRKSAYISNIQQQLPRLSEAGVIDYDSRQKTVRPLAPLDAVYSAHRAVERALD
ncbi:DUF7344 domain-containing protein [Haloarcula limicola]|uniref:DUF7344 domain-containing protein n=1 Tax=Haloarcula limicola TaxID=1429915 RepID=UPI003BB07543